MLVWNDLVIAESVIKLNGPINYDFAGAFILFRALAACHLMCAFRAIYCVSITGNKMEKCIRKI